MGVPRARDAIARLRGEETVGLRIAFFSESFRENLGGLTRAVIQMHDRLVARGHQVRVFTLAQRGGPIHPGDLIRIPAIPLPGMGALTADRWIAYHYHLVLRELARFAPDVVHLHTPFPTGWLGIRAARRLSLPVVATYHANVAGTARAYVRGPIRPVVGRLVDLIDRAEVAFYSRAHLVTAPSRWAADRLLQRGLRAPVAVVSNGVDLRRFTPHREGVPGGSTRCAGQTRPPTALYVGRLSTEKGVPELETVVRHVLSAHPSACFRIVGEGPWRKRLLHRFEPLVRAGRLRLDGYVAWENMPQVYRDADVLVFPSAVETQGLAVLEAMASGLPVVGVRSGAVAELVEDGKSGFLVAPGDGRALAEAVLRLLQDEPLQRAMADQALKAASRHDLDATAASLEQIYSSVTEARVAGRTAGPATLGAARPHPPASPARSAP